MKAICFLLCLALLQGAIAQRSSSVSGEDEKEGAGRSGISTSSSSSASAGTAATSSQSTKTVTTKTEVKTEKVKEDVAEAEASTEEATPAVQTHVLHPPVVKTLVHPPVVKALVHPPPTYVLPPPSVLPLPYTGFHVQGVLPPPPPPVVPVPSFGPYVPQVPFVATRPRLEVYQLSNGYDAVAVDNPFGQVAQYLYLGHDIPLTTRGSSYLLPATDILNGHSTYVNLGTSSGHLTLSQLKVGDVLYQGFRGFDNIGPVFVPAQRKERRLVVEPIIYRTNLLSHYAPALPSPISAVNHPIVY